MQVTQAIRRMCADSGLTHRQIAGRLGKYDTYISQIITRKTDLQTSSLVDIARACGYRLQLVSVDSGERITIGDDTAPEQASHSIADVRRMLVQATAILDGMDE